MGLEGWKKITCEEIEALLDNPFNNRRDYQCIITNSINWILHFVENSTLSPQFVYNPGRKIAIDETMIKGRSSLKQYMPKKPIRGD